MEIWYNPRSPRASIILMCHWCSGVLPSLSSQIQKEKPRIKMWNCLPMCPFISGRTGLHTQLRLSLKHKLSAWHLIIIPSARAIMLWQLRASSWWCLVSLWPCLCFLAQHCPACVSLSVCLLLFCPVPQNRHPFRQASEKVNWVYRRLLDTSQEESWNRPLLGPMIKIWFLKHFVYWGRMALISTFHGKARAGEQPSHFWTWLLYLQSLSKFLEFHQQIPWGLEINFLVCGWAGGGLVCALKCLYLPRPPPSLLPEGDSAKTWAV